jgi:hypothetical protein
MPLPQYAMLKATLNAMLKAMQAVFRPAQRSLKLGCCANQRYS